MDDLIEALIKLRVALEKRNVILQGIALQHPADGIALENEARLQRRDLVRAASMEGLEGMRAFKLAGVTIAWPGAPAAHYGLGPFRARAGDEP